MATLPVRHPRDRTSSYPLSRNGQVTRHKRMKSSGFAESVNSLSVDSRVSSSRTRHFQEHFIMKEPHPPWQLLSAHYQMSHCGPTWDHGRNCLD